MAAINPIEFQRMQLIDRLNQVADSMRSCATVAEQFALTVAGGSSSDVTLAAPQTGKRKAQVLEDGEPDGKKKRAPRKIKDPNAPKRPASSYLLYQNDVRAELKTKYPGIPNSELLQMIAKRWAAMSDTEKEKYNKQNTTEKEAYAAQKAIYDANSGAGATSPTPAPAIAAPKKRVKQPELKPTPAPVEAASTSDSDESGTGSDSSSGSEDASEAQSGEEEDEEEVEPAQPAKKAKKTPVPALVSKATKEKKEKKQKA